MGDAADADLGGWLRSERERTAAAERDAYAWWLSRPTEAERARAAVLYEAAADAAAVADDLCRWYAGYLLRRAGELVRVMGG